MARSRAEALAVSYSGQWSWIVGLVIAHSCAKQLRSKMNEDLVQSLILKLQEARLLYYRLVLLVGPSGSGKTQCLRKVASRKGFPLLSLSLDLSRALLPLTARQRALQVPGVIRIALERCDSSTVLVDNPELIFSPALKQNPLRLLESLSRTRTLGVAWPGKIAKGWINYAEPDHAEHRRYPIKDFLVVDAQAEKPFYEDQA